MLQTLRRAIAHGVHDSDTGESTGMLAGRIGRVGIIVLVGTHRLNDDCAIHLRVIHEREELGTRDPDLLVPTRTACVEGAQGVVDLVGRNDMHVGIDQQGGLRAGRDELDTAGEFRSRQAQGHGA
jgi:hypothetical protein